MPSCGAANPSPIYFRHVKPGGELHTRLSSEEDDPERCGWGASMSEGRFQEETAAE